LICAVCARLTALLGRRLLRLLPLAFLSAGDTRPVPDAFLVLPAFPVLPVWLGERSFLVLCALGCSAEEAELANTTSGREEKSPGVSHATIGRKSRPGSQ
jgi:hypothetical protein